MSINCIQCGQLQDVKEYDSYLWDLYHRMKSGVQNNEPLIFTSNWIEENIFDEDDHDAMMTAMSRDMVNRRLCPTCSRPDLRGLTDDDFYSEEDAEAMADMWAMEAAERRMGC